MKRCWDCKTDKPVDDFGKARKYADGLNDRCKECVKEANAQRYAMVKVAVAEYKERHGA